ncbi:hypothetical protein NM208_g1425 [Fusarium decemcellulare]|uniref:Uncharacterized protein n=1 Tax=Fusarium decemcellulare TaxID=57161 RepID=A0ACC1SW68_9HYPO|nr:hypothetical protein NM208_g1425 [Fusarium decemcellulare]
MSANLLSRFLWCLVLVVAFPVLSQARDADKCESSRYEHKHRLFVLTDISNEPDDQMSLVRLLTYANELDIHGIAATTSTWMPDEIDYDTIVEVLEGYRKVVGNLNSNVPSSAAYPSADYLLDRVFKGHPVYGRASLNRTLSQAAKELVKAADASSVQDPLWVSVWGGAAILAEALQHVSKTRSKNAVASFVDKLRVYAISDQDDTGIWIRQRYPQLFFVVSLHGWNEYTDAAWNGISGEEYRRFDQGGPDSSIVSNEWLQQHIRIGDLGSHYLNWSFIMEGDTPSFLPLIQNGLGHIEHPDWGSWGGRYTLLDQTNQSRVYADATDYVQGLNGQGFVSKWATIWRWRKDYQYDFAARMQWTVESSFSKNNHAPVAIVNGSCGPAPLELRYTPGDEVVLDASESWDPDDDQLSFDWFHYREAGGRGLEGFTNGKEFKPRFKLTLVSQDVNITSVQPNGSVVTLQTSESLDDPVHIILTMASPVEGLCDICAAIDFKSLICRPQDDNHKARSIPLGNLEAIIERVDKCGVCSLIIEALRERYRRTPPANMADIYFGYPDHLVPRRPGDVEKYGIPLTWMGKPIQCSIKEDHLCVRRYRLPGRKGEMEVKNSDQQQSKEQGKDSRVVADNISRIVVELTPCLWANTAAQFGLRLHATWDGHDQIALKTQDKTRVVSPVGFGRRVNPLLDISMIRGWLHQCEKEHGDRCAYPSWMSGGEDDWPRNLRVIDVQERRIVNLAPGGRYIALSYVWGLDKKGLESRFARCLGTKTFPQLSRTNGLDTIALPQTVKDAMSLTSNINERYLWVDALCILQDDIDDLTFHTGQMDLVYAGAVFTIVAAMVSEEGWSLSTTATLCYEDSLQLSAWNSRGWTYQERILSRRALVFTPYQIYWICEKSTWDEEVILEPPEMEVNLLNQALWCNDEWDDGFPKFSKHTFLTYIKSYSSRQLTFPSDAFSAFSGILRRYEHLNKEHTFWGIPTERFDLHLLWSFGDERRAESHRVMLEGSGAHYIPYPSWSWLGWTGFISALMFGYFYRIQDPTSELKFYSLMSDRSLRVLDTRSFPSETENASVDGRAATAATTPEWKGETTIKEPIVDCYDQLTSQISALDISDKEGSSPVPNLPVHDTGRLIFRTSHVQALVWTVQSQDGKNWLHIEAEDFSLKTSADAGFYAVDNSEATEDVSGTASDQTRAGDCEDAEPAKAKMDFIVISRYLDTHASEGEKTCHLDIMLIKESATEPGIWSRRTLVIIEEKDWLRLKPSWKTVILA